VLPGAGHRCSAPPAVLLDSKIALTGAHIRAGAAKRVENAAQESSWLPALHVRCSRTATPLGEVHACECVRWRQNRMARTVACEPLCAACCPTCGTRSASAPLLYFLAICCVRGARMRSHSLFGPPFVRRSFLLLNHKLARWVLAPAGTTCRYGWACVKFGLCVEFAEQV